MFNIYIVDVQLHLESVPIINKIMNPNPAHGEVYWISSGYSVSSTNKDDRHDIAKAFLKVALDTIALTLTIYIDDHLVKFLPA
jgi:hypothetical protein